MTRGLARIGLLTIGLVACFDAAGCMVPNYAFDGAVVADAGCTMCGTACVDLSSSVLHCGACATACPVRDNTVLRCRVGQCEAPCMPEFADCDGNVENGCETRISASATNCGRCGNACPTGPTFRSTCISAVCGLDCMPPRENCDGDMSNGCEADLTSSSQHCGSCGRPCVAGPGATVACVDRACVPMCNADLGDCNGLTDDGCEVDLRTTMIHCGACGNPCMAGRRCVAGVCT